MMPIQAPPELDPRIETMFEEVLAPPEGYEYVHHDSRLLYPCYGQDSWRLQLLHKESGVVKPFFISGNFLRQMAKALQATREAMEKAVTDDLAKMSVSPVTQ